MAQAQVHILEAGGTRFGLCSTPTVLYKHFHKEAHAEALVAHGGIRIGTLYEFRHTDDWDPARADGGEGEFTFTVVSEQPELVTRDNAPWFLRPVLEALGTPIASHGGNLSTVATHPDTYLYCSSAVTTQQTRARYGEFVVRIADVPGFFRALTAHLFDDLGAIAADPHGYAAPCLYLDRAIRLGTAFTPLAEPPLAMLKPTRWRDDQEVRALWHPRVPAPRLKPLCTVHGALAHFCERVRWHRDPA